MTAKSSHRANSFLKETVAGEVSDLVRWEAYIADDEGPGVAIELVR